MSKCVLVVDDDPDHRNICVTILRHRGYRVLEAADGGEAVQLATEHLPDLVLMDAMLPTLDGWQATKRVKSAVRTAHIPVIMFTARALPQDRERSFATGADSHLAKPCEPLGVVEEVARFIGPPEPSAPPAG